MDRNFYLIKLKIFDTLNNKLSYMANVKIVFSTFIYLSLDN